MTSRIEGPSLLDFHRHVLANPVLYFHELMLKHGDLVRCRSAKDIYLISNVDYARELLQRNQRSLTKNDPVNLRLRKVIGPGVVVSSTADQWKSQRSRAQSIVQKERLKSYQSPISHHTEALVRQWTTLQKQDINLQDSLCNHLLDVLLSSLFREEDDQYKAQLLQAFQSGYAFVGNASYLNWRDHLPFSKNNRLLRQALKMDEVIAAMIHAHQQSGRYAYTLLADIVESEDLGSSTASELIAEIKNILAAGHFSTTDLLCWIVYELANHPEWTRRIREELLTGETSASLPSFLHEVMRCYPPVWSSWHQSNERIQLDQHELPEGSTIMISIFNIQRNPNYWKHPHQFNPGRFEHNEVKFKAFMPFGIGQRKCLGMHLANQIIEETVKQLILNFHLTPSSQYAKPEIQSRVTLGSKYPMFIRAEKLD